jgi:hypothetical protein
VRQSADCRDSHERAGQIEYKTQTRRHPPELDPPGGRGTPPSRTMETHEPDASRRHDEDASTAEAHRLYPATTPCRHTLKGSGDGERPLIVHPFVLD